MGLLPFGNPRRMGLLGLVPLAHVGQGAPPTAHVAPRGRWPHPVGPRDPSGGLGTIPMTPKLVPMAETGLPIYKSLPPDHSGTPRDVRDLIRDSEQLSVNRIHTFPITLASSNLKCVDPTGSGDMQT